MNFANHVDFAAQNVPTRPAIGDANGLRTYGELAAETDRMANALKSLGTDPGDTLAICLENRLELLISYLGAMKRGVIPVPVNTQFNDRQIEYVLETSDASALVTDGRWAGVAETVESPITVDGSVGHRFEPLLEDADDEYELYPRRNEETAEILYTSGTTGRPKGVRHTHGNLDANAQGIRKYMDWTRREVGLTVCQCFHVIGLNVTTTPLLVAEAENRVLPEWDPEAVLEAIETHRVTYTFFTPGMIIDLLDHDGVERYDLSSLDRVGVGGSPMPRERLDDAERTLGCPVLEGYGMTETTPLAAFNPVGIDRRKPGSVGPPAEEVVELRIEDLDTEAVVAAGERGELLWRGDTVTPGYVQFQGDGQRFVERDGKTWLRSGDIGRLDDDGYLYVVDRREDMFTTGCANVFPREIEDVLYQIDQVAEAAIIDVTDDLRGAVVTAVIKRNDTDLTAERVKETCRANLDDHEVPQRIEFVGDIPRTATGKIDRIELRDTF
ncbi:class I adenylate-forming enzyme family protein [Natronorubrum sp. DTA7]|uniref:class I adenylate-forming enzyme family protein n=1 Tax=Natronorubrum sp. DTA7 TaxID=3447016 RepID=UPI003F86AFAE